MTPRHGFESASSSSIASLLGAGVRLLLGPLVARLARRLEVTPLTGRDVPLILGRAGVGEAEDSKLRFWKKPTIDFCVLPDCELERDFFREGGLIGGLVEFLEVSAITIRLVANQTLTIGARGIVLKKDDGGKLRWT